MHHIAIVITEGEALQDFTKRFKVAKDVLESHLGGPIMLKRFISNMEGFVSESHENYANLASMAFEQYLAYVYLEQSEGKNTGANLVD